MTILDRIGRLKFFQTEVNILQQAGTLTHNLALVYSPLNKKIIERGAKMPKKEQETFYPTSILGNNIRTGSLQSNPWTNDPRLYRYSITVDDDADAETWYKYLFRPAELSEMIKRFHLVGDKVVKSIFIHLLIAFYLWFKALFHALYTRNDEDAAEYFAAHYYPRLFESYHNQYELYGLLCAQCSYILSLRLYTIMRLIKRSVINRNGYKEIEMSQLNGLFAECFKWPLKDWFRVCVLGRRHLNACNHKSDALLSNDIRASGDSGRSSCGGRGSCDKNVGKMGEREGHLYCKSYDWNKLVGSTRSDFLCETNPIDFSECYRYHNLPLNNNLCTDYYYPADNCRMDIWELSWLATLLIAGTPISVYLITNSLISNFMLELAAISPNGFQSTVMERLQQLPYLLVNGQHLVRLMDTYSFYWLLHHHQFEQAQIHVDICTFLSRVRKLNDRLQADLEVLTNLSAADSSPVINDASDGTAEFRARRKAINASLETNIFLAKVINDEFMRLQKSTTTFLDLLVIGEGFCVAAALSIMFATESKFVYYVAFTCFMYAIVSMVISACLCMTVEIRFKILMATINRLLVYKGAYIKTRIVRLLLAELTRYEQTSDRAFKIIGQYPLTSSTLGQYVIFLSSCAILVVRFIS